MKEQFRQGRWIYIGYIILDLLLLLIANVLAIFIYLNSSRFSYTIEDYEMVILYMVVIDIAVTLVFNTLDRVLRRRKKKELVESAEHVAISFVLLALLLFSMKQGAAYSRATIYLAYGFYFVFIVLAHILVKKSLRKNQSKKTPTALLITTAGYAIEGLSVVENSGIEVKGFFITDKTNEGAIRNIPVMVDRKDATAFLCWSWIDKVYICGPESIDVPDALLDACRQMGIPVHRTPSKESFSYEIMKIRTVLQKEDRETGLSFFESEHDIPFQVRRFYTIYESEQDYQTGFHPNKQSWHLLFCPYGAIDVMIDTGREKKTVQLSDPSVGLIIHPSVWREMVWKKHESILCVAASGHYDIEKFRHNYDEYLKYLQEKEWAAVLESEQILGEAML